MGVVWTWLGAIKGETWGAFAAALVIFVIKVVGPLLTRAVTRRFQREVRELEKLAENAREETHLPLDAENGRLRIQLTRARLDLDEVTEDMRKLANRNAQLEEEIERWKKRAAASAAEADELRKAMEKGGKHVDAGSRKPGGPGGPSLLGGSGGRVPGRGDNVPTLPPARRPRRESE